MHLLQKSENQMSKTSPLSNEGLSPSLSLSLADENQEKPFQCLIIGCKRTERHKVTQACYRIEVVSPKTGKPFRKQSELQHLSSELNWDLAQIRGATHQLVRLAHKYNLIIPKLFLKDVPAADVIVGFEKELRERVKESRVKRTKQIKEKKGVDTNPAVE